MITKEHEGKRVLLVKVGVFCKYNNPDQRDITELSPSGNYFRWNGWSDWQRSSDYMVVEVLGDAKP